MRIRSVAAASLSTALLLGVVAPASAQDDPYQLLTEAVTATASATSFHVLAEASGALNMGESMGDMAFPIDGTRIEGDISVTPPAVSLTFELPLQGFPISGGVIVPGDGKGYLKLALPMGSVDDLWHVIPVGAVDMAGALSSPRPAADLAADLKAELDAAGVVITNEGETSCAAGTCTRLHLEIPSAVVKSNLGPIGDLGGMLTEPSPAASEAPAPPIPADILIDNASGRLDSFTATYANPASGTDIALTVTLSAYDVPVAITPPPADQITDEPVLGGAFGS
jgi:hypothetical protein